MSVHCDQARERWVVRWREAGRQRARRFASEDAARTFDASVSPARSAAALEAPTTDGAGVHVHETAHGPRCTSCARGAA